MSDNNFETNQNLEPVSREGELDSHALDDATFEPTARIEQTQDFKTAEAVEQEFVTAMDQYEAHQNNRPDSGEGSGTDTDG